MRVAKEKEVYVLFALAMQPRSIMKNASVALTDL
jgi:hypothetical protein